MLGFSFAKLLVLAAVVGVIWFAFRHVGRVEAVRRALGEEFRRRQRAERQRRQPLAAEDLVKCRVCDAYVAARGAAACGRADCPWGR
jgi:hypothetical protein